MHADRDSRRKFLQLGLAATGTGAVASLGMTGCQPQHKSSANSSQPENRATQEPLSPGIDLERWNRIKDEPYELGHFGTLPGVCQLPGPQSKKNWPDRDKYKGVKKVPGMCQLCSSVCGIMGYVKNGRVIKIEGNPNDPNSRGHLCARGHRPDQYPNLEDDQRPLVSLIL